RPTHGPRDDRGRAVYGAVRSADDVHRRAFSSAILRLRPHIAAHRHHGGMTETSPVSTQSLLDDPLEKRVSTVGRVHPHIEVKIIDPETGRIVPHGTPG